MLNPHNYWGRMPSMKVTIAATNLWILLLINSSMDSFDKGFLLKIYKILFNPSLMQENDKCNTYRVIMCKLLLIMYSDYMH